MTRIICIITVVLAAGTLVRPTTAHPGHGAPQISFDENNVPVEAGSPALTDAELLDGVTAEDAFGADLTNDVRVIGVIGPSGRDFVDTSFIGTYQVVYEVADSSNDIGQGFRAFTVDDTIAPTITNAISLIKIRLGAPPPDLLTGIEAHDSFEGDITDSVSIAFDHGNSLDTSTVGVTIVSYSAIDGEDNTSDTVMRTYVVDGSAPIISVTDTVVTLAIGAAVPPLRNNVVAHDDVDGDITAAITATVTGGGPIDTAVPGESLVTYMVTDEAGNPAEPKTRIYRVKDFTGPVISVTPTVVIIEVGSDPPVLIAGVTATDNVDGDITDSVVPLPSVVNTVQPGSVTVTYTVSDQAGNAAVPATRRYDIVTSDDFPPTIEVVPNFVTLSVGDTLAPTITAGVTATDNVDTDLTDMISIGGDTPDTSQAGIYRVTYVVTDSSGNQSETVQRTYEVRRVASENDNDDDGLEDGWEIQHFGNCRWRGDDDADHDGRSNLDEYELDLDPLQYELRLEPDWNLISMSHMPDDHSVDAILRDVSGQPLPVSGMWAWSVDQQQYVTTQTLGSFTGFWIFTDRACQAPIDVPTSLADDMDCIASGIQTGDDKDDDGLRDDWEMANFGTMRWHGVDDLDADGKTNLQEQDVSDPTGFPIAFSRGWNLVSLPCVPADAQPESVFAEKVEVNGTEERIPVYSGNVWKWDSGTYRFTPASVIESLCGYWIYVDSEITIDIDFP